MSVCACERLYVRVCASCSVTKAGGFLIPKVPDDAEADGVLLPLSLPLSSKFFLAPVLNTNQARIRASVSGHVHGQGNKFGLSSVVQ